MRYYRDPYGRLRATPNNQPNTQQGSMAPNAGRVTLEDYQKLAQAYQTLQQRVEKLQQNQVAVDDTQESLAALRQELQIKDEALQRQTADMKQMESELMWARAAVQQQDKAEQSDEEALSWRERYMRLQAELDNLRRRWEQRFADDTAGARRDIIRDMLPFVDHLELALRHGEALIGKQAQEYVRNIEVIHQAFLATLRRYDVTKIEAQGQPFDPNVHEAVGTVQNQDVPDDQVVEVIQAGYMDGEELLRPAKVLVNKHPE